MPIHRDMQRAFYRSEARRRFITETPVSRADFEEPGGDAFSDFLVVHLS